MNTAHILVVDDEPQIRRVMRTTLVARGYTVSDARNGEEALEKVREERYDLVLLDINMPGIGGMETCRIIRSQSDIPIVVLWMPAPMIMLPSPSARRSSLPAFAPPCGGLR